MGLPAVAHPSTIFLVSFLCFFTLGLAQPASLSFQDCSSGDTLDPSQRINVTTVYGQIVTDNSLGKHLNLTVLGDTGKSIIPISNDTGRLATLFTTSSFLSFTVWDNSTFFCSTLLPPSPLPALDPASTTFYCPITAGPLAFSATVPFKNHDYELFTLNTRLRVVDTSEPAVELACVDIAATPLVVGPVGSIYGHAAIIFWTSVSLAIGYWLVVGLGRIAAAWGRGSRAGPDLWSRFESGGFILASAISGERLAVTPALMRFGTPSMRDILFHTQWCAALAMVAVQWPVFVYPLLAQTAWATLSYNITLTQGAEAAEEHWNPLTVQTYNPPSQFADQLADSSSPIYINSSATNTLLMLPPNTASGMESFAYAVGLRPQDLFGVCLGLFLSIVAVTIVLSLLFWGLDRLASLMLGKERSTNIGTRSPSYAPGKDVTDKAVNSTTEDDYQTSGNSPFRPSSIPIPNAFGRSRWRHRIPRNSLHGSILHGNLVRTLILFHLPITIFSCYQFTSGRTHTTLGAVVLAAFSFAAISVAFPLWLILRLTRTATNKLYDETRTLLMLGPLYNHYGHGSQLFACLFFATNVAFGITIGCGQKSGTAQAIIILVVEVASALGTSIWLPWGQGASMGLISFFFCVARITVAVLLVILAPVVSVGDAAGGWVACAILFILGLIYLGFLLILFIKLTEALLRIVGRVPFDRSKYNVDNGLFGVMGLMGCCGPKRRRSQRKRYRASDATRSGTFTFTPQYNAAKGSTPMSSVAGPPSVLRPEHVQRPYREDSDDESGFIMGAWQPFPRREYSPISDPPPHTPPAEPPAPKSGFSRVGGGRAHFDSPYAISSGSTQQLNSPEPNQTQNVASGSHATLPPARLPDSAKNPSTISVNHQVSSGLPPGAMSPARPAVHVRTKSQTAIIEDASSLYNLQPSGGSNNAAQEHQLRNEPLTPPQIPVEEDDSSEGSPPRRKHWYNIRRTRRMSEGNDDSTQEPSPPPEADNSRSFVVVRDKRPSPLSRPQSTRPDATTAGSEQNDEHGPKFVVVRESGPTIGTRSASSSDILPRPPPIPRRSSRRNSHT